MKLVKQVFVFLFILTSLFACGFILIANAYEEELKASAANAINKKLSTEVNVSSLEIDAFKKFPFISIKLENAFAKDAVIKVNNSDTLFYFEEVFLQFNILDVINKTYILREISLENGLLNIRKDKEGSINYNIFQQKNDNASSAKIELEKVYFNNVLFTYSNKQRNDNISLELNSTYFKGEFEKQIFELDLYGEVYIKSIEIGKQAYLNNKFSKLDLGLNINSKASSYNFKRGNITINNNLNFNVVGLIENNKETNYDLTISGDKIDISDSFVLLPFQVSKYLKEYKSDGYIDFKTTISGKASKTKSPKIITKFSVLNGTLSDNKNGLTLNKLNLEGVHNNEGIFRLNQVNTVIGDGSVKGSFEIKNFNHPQIKIHAESNITLANFLSLIKVDTLTGVTGDIELSGDLSGPIKDLKKITFNDFENLSSKGSIKIKNCGFSIKEQNKPYNDINALLELKGNDIKIKNLSAQLKDSDFNLEGTFTNALSYVFLKNQKLAISAKFHANFLNLNQILETTTDEESSYVFALSKNIQLKLRTDIDSLCFRAFNATNVNATVSVKNQQLILNPLSMNCLSGHLAGEGMVNAKTSSKIGIKANFKATSISVPKLFNQLENFNQNTLTEYNLKGVADASINYTMLMDSSLTIDEKSILSTVDLNIENGQLIDFKPLIEVASYIKGNKLLKTIVKPEELAKRLSHIKFKSLKNTIQIENATISIPKMNIKSNAMDLNISGAHGFNNSIDYSMNFYLSDLLTTEEAERNIKGKTRVFLHMTGTVDDPNIEYDKLAGKEGVKEEFLNEKNEVKTLIKEEFGLFEKDTSLKNTKAPVEKLNYTIEWEEEEQQAKPKEKKEEKKGLKGFLKSNQTDKNDAEDFDFDDDDF